MGEVSGIGEGPVKWEDLDENTGNEGGLLGQSGGEEPRRKLTLNNEGMGSKRD
jgi:hypothetical protein